MLKNLIKSRINQGCLLLSAILVAQIMLVGVVAEEVPVNIILESRDADITFLDCTKNEARINASTGPIVVRPFSVGRTKVAFTNMVPKDDISCELITSSPSCVYRFKLKYSGSMDSWLVDGQDACNEASLGATGLLRSEDSLLNFGYAAEDNKLLGHDILFSVVGPKQPALGNIS